MTASGRPGPPTAVVSGDTTFVCARDAKNRLLYVVRDFFGWRGAEAGGDLAGDPTAVVTTSGAIHVLARCRGGRLRHWTWDGSVGEEPSPGALVEQPDHGWFAAYDPVAVSTQDGGFLVHARGADDVLLRWHVTADGTASGPESLGGSVAARPANLRRTGRVPDVFVVGVDGTVAHHGFRGRLNGTSDVVGWRDIGSGATGAPVAVNWGGDRLDVLAPGADSELLHWGFSPTFGFHTELVPGEDPADPEADRIHIAGSWFPPDIGDLGTATRLDCAIAVAPNIARVFGRDAQGHIVRWHWDGGIHPPGTGWFGPDAVGKERSSAPTTVINGGEATAIAWTGEGTTLTEHVLTDNPLPTERWKPQVLPVQWAEGSEQPAMLELPVEVRALLSRPQDLVRLGLSWEGFDVVPGAPPTLVPTPGATQCALRLVFPPQSVGEEVLLPGDTVGDRLGGLRSGPSQLVLDVAAAPVALTAEGVLAASRGAVVRGDDPLATQVTTFIELPWQLFVSPDGAVVRHGSKPARAGDGTASLWRTTLRSDDGTLRIRRAGSEDPFGIPLTAANRASIAVQDGPARFERLELTSLGGDLSASGSWDKLSWEHETRLGRDQRVRVTTRGILFPYGHRAELTELTERHLATPGEDVAALRKQTFLTVTQATRTRSRDATLTRAFPFTSVTITQRRFDDVAAPDWRTGTRMAKEPTDVRFKLDLALNVLANLPRAVDDWTGPVPLPEDVAGFAGDLELTGTIQQRQGRLALDRIVLIEAIQDLQEQLDAVMDVGSPPVNQFFTPRVGTRWVEFPVTCTTGGETVSFSTPMIFVVDDEYADTPTHQAYDTLKGNNVQRRIQDEWATIRSGAPASGGGTELRRDHDFAGVVTLGGGPLDVIGTGAPEDQELVHRIYVSGRLEGRTFHPALGRGDVSVDVPQPTWGLDITLPSLQELLPGAPLSHRVVTAFTDAYLTQGAAEDVIHTVVGPAIGARRVDGLLVDEAGKALSALTGVQIDFTKNADRSGGLVSPKLVADALSREAGPVNLAGLTSLDPAKLFDEGATLLGFSLASLLESILPGGLPTITTDTSGPQPVVTMSWPAQEPGLEPDDQPAQTLTPRAPFGPADPDDPPPSLSLVVRTAGSEVRTEATLRNFSLSFPTVKPLIRLVFDQLRYVQEAGRAPDLQVKGLDAQFSEELDILKALQEKIGLGDKGPTIRVDESGIVAAYSFAVPDAQSGAFVMRNLAFSAGVTVPFQGEPVSLDLAFASRAAPFNLSVMMFGGGGYVELGLTHKGLSKLDVALEFGASIGVDFVIAKGEAHVLGGIRFELVGEDAVKLTGYLRVGGSLEVLGLVTVSVELVLSLGYESTGNRLVGRATLVIEIDLTLYSDSIELDSGEWEIAGGAERANDPLNGPPPRFGAALGEDPFLALVREQRSAFARFEGDEE